jgi:hypothetical protein
VTNRNACFFPRLSRRAYRRARVNGKAAIFVSARLVWPSSPETHLWFSYTYTHPTDKGADQAGVVCAVSILAREVGTRLTHAVSAPAATCCFTPTDGCSVFGKSVRDIGRRILLHSSTRLGCRRKPKNRPLSHLCSCSPLFDHVRPTRQFWKVFTRETKRSMVECRLLIAALV